MVGGDPKRQRTDGWRMDQKDRVYEIAKTLHAQHIKTVIHQFGAVPSRLYLHVAHDDYPKLAQLLPADDYLLVGTDDVLENHCINQHIIHY